jgi:glycosyltransferase involved in cell wall biosynthesis
VSLVDAPAVSGQRAAEYGAAWTTALTSLRQAFPLEAAESLASGTPVVGGRAEAFPEVVDRDAVGRLFDEEGGQRALSRALLEALELAEDAATSTACRELAERYSSERSARAYLDLYNELLTSMPRSKAAGARTGVPA